MEHHFLAITEGSSLGSFPTWFFKINLAYRCLAPRQFRFCRRKSEFYFSSNGSIKYWELERNRLKKFRKKHVFRCVLAFSGRKPVYACFVMLLCVGPSASICSAGSGNRNMGYGCLTVFFSHARQLWMDRNSYSTRVTEV